MDPRIAQPPPRGLTWGKIVRAAAFFAISTALLIGGMVALVQDDGSAAPLLSFGGILLVFALVYLGLLLRMRRIDRENRFGTPLR